ncbi:DUF1187 family protein [Escherichia coli]|uniref:DUF1187 family protein n=1 Tax=Escherichia coli TaxID=562 RepID=UPI0009841484|nr:DUF1187 family protein [Escherichia coli]EFA4458324.1 DUF1187 family protein [Escherichia coli O153]EEU9148101.1 DUF1187 family protein [Escherichia coli]EFB2600967.1 DUF1187 family protein [Escherichia coli]EFN3691882.1 DUF1187 family protein [Escherichia coli]EGI0701851.1 DUF1187 family protein [Escherichia coli]
MSCYQINAVIQKSDGIPFIWRRNTGEVLKEEEYRKFFPAQKKVRVQLKIPELSCTLAKK